LLAVFMLAFALRLGFVYYLEPERLYFSDSIEYLRAADGLLHGAGFGESYKRPPLYSIFMAGVLAVGQGHLVAVKVVDAILGALTVLVVYAIGKKIWGQPVGLTAAALVAVHPYLFVLSAFVYSETLFTLLLALATLVLLKARGLAGTAAAGVLGGLACLTRPSALAFLVVGAVWILFATRGPLQRRAARATVLVATIALTISPWLVRNYRLFGELTPLDARTEVHLPYLVDGRFISKLEYFRTRGRKMEAVRYPDTVLHILREPGAYVVYVAGQLKALWTITPDHLQTASASVRQKAAALDARMIVQNHPAEKVSHYVWFFAVALTPYYALALFGVWAGRARFREAALLLLIIVSVSLGYAFFFARLRYRLPIEPYVATFAAVGLQTLVGALPRRRAQSRLAPEAVVEEALPLVSSRRG
jgi:4-amino-4-deoxy-L-arabinose transferase-like glycosyltransferase